VDVLDLLLVLAGWGCGDQTAGKNTHGDEISACGLDDEDWDDYMDILDTGTTAEKENATCWMYHYLDHHREHPICSQPPTCPDDDPFGNH